MESGEDVYPRQPNFILKIADERSRTRAADISAFKNMASLKT